MKVEKLKEILQTALDNLDYFDDEEEIKMVTNTYFIKDKSLFIGTYEGYFSLKDIETNETENNSDDEELEDEDVCANCMCNPCECAKQGRN